MNIEESSIIDLMLMTTARAYNLSLADERSQSVKDLEVLFYRIIRELKSELFVEAGAKDAASSRRARKYLPESKIVAFEANPLTYSRFKDLDNKGSEVEYIHAALSNTNSKVTFNIRVIDGKPVADGQGSILRGAGDTKTHKPVTVDGYRLDKYFPPKTFKNWASWIDVEGASELVLTGAEGILDKCDAIFIEVSDRPSVEKEWLTGDVMDFLAKFDLIPVGRDFQSRYLYNVLFIHKKHIRNARVRLFLIEYFGGNTVTPKDI